MRTVRILLASSAALAVIGLVRVGPGGASVGPERASALLLSDLNPVRLARRGWRAARSAASRVAGKVKSAAKAVGRAAKSVGRKAAGAARWVGGKAKSAAKWTYDKAKSAAKWTWGKAKSAGGWAWGKAKSAAKVIKKGLDMVKSAAGWLGNKAKSGAKRAYRGVKKAAKAVKSAAKRAYRFAKNVLNVIKRYGKRILQRVKDWFVDKAKALGNKVIDKVRGLIRKAISFAQRKSETIQKIRSAIRSARAIADAVANPEQYIEAGKEKLAEALTEAAMKKLHPLLVKANVFLVLRALYVLKRFVRPLIRKALEAGVKLAAGALGAVVVRLARPLTRWTLDKAMNWAIRKVAGFIGDLLFKYTRPLLRDHIIRPLIDKGYSRLVRYLKRRFPKAAQAAAAVQGAAGKVGAVLGAAEKATDVKAAIRAGKRADQELGKLKRKISGKPSRSRAGYQGSRHRSRSRHHSSRRHRSSRRGKRSRSRHKHGTGGKG